MPHAISAQAELQLETKAEDTFVPNFFPAQPALGPPWVSLEVAAELALGAPNLCVLSVWLHSAVRLCLGALLYV